MPTMKSQEAEEAEESAEETVEADADADDGSGRLGRRTDGEHDVTTEYDRRADAGSLRNVTEAQIALHSYHTGEAQHGSVNDFA